LTSPVSQRAITTFCWLPPDRVPTDCFSPRLRKDRLHRGLDLRGAGCLSQPNVIAVGGGPDKANAIRSLLMSEVVNTAVIGLATARLMLDQRVV
jgi:hypothetical protein